MAVKVFPLFPEPKMTEKDSDGLYHLVAENYLGAEHYLGRVT
jgi:hypothetical protein